MKRKLRGKIKASWKKDVGTYEEMCIPFLRVFVLRGTQRLDVMAGLAREC